MRYVQTIAVEAEQYTGKNDAAIIEMYGADPVVQKAKSGTGENDCALILTGENGPVILRSGWYIIRNGFGCVSTASKEDFEANFRKVDA